MAETKDFGAYSVQTKGSRAAIIAKTPQALAEMRAFLEQAKPNPRIPWTPSQLSKYELLKLALSHAEQAIGEDR